MTNCRDPSLPRTTRLNSSGFCPFPYIFTIVTQHIWKVIFRYSLRLPPHMKPTSWLISLCWLSSVDLHLLGMTRNCCPLGLSWVRSRALRRSSHPEDPVLWLHSCWQHGSVPLPVAQPVLLAGYFLWLCLTEVQCKLLNGRDRLSYLAEDCEVRRNLGVSTRAFFN